MTQLGQEGEVVDVHLGQTVEVQTQIAQVVEGEAGEELVEAAARQAEGDQPEERADVTGAHPAAVGVQEPQLPGLLGQRLSQSTFVFLEKSWRFNVFF